MARTQLLSLLSTFTKRKRISNNNRPCYVTELIYEQWTHYMITFINLWTRFPRFWSNTNRWRDTKRDQTGVLNALKSHEHSQKAAKLSQYFLRGTTKLTFPRVTNSVQVKELWGSCWMGLSTNELNGPFAAERSFSQTGEQMTHWDVHWDMSHCVICSRHFLCDVIAQLQKAHYPWSIACECHYKSKSKLTHLDF